MEYTPREIVLKNGETCVIRRAEEADAEELLACLKATSGETPYMAREPEEITLTAEEERSFLRRKTDAQRELMLCAWVGGRLAGSASFVPVSERRRLRHRCTVGVSLYREFWGLGIGTALLGEVLAAARTAGYEQAELDVVSTNAPAVAVYRKLGFEAVGTIPRAMKYRDGSRADLLLMVKPLP